MNEQIKAYLNQAVDDGVFPGCHCLIVTENQTDFYCIGNKSMVPNKEENQNDTIYDLASLTKVIATTPAILRLIQFGKLSYDTKVNQIIPTFKNNDITIKHLLTHTSGLPADLGWGLESDKEIMIHDICEYASHVRPGQKVIYSDIGYMILGIIIETITKKTLDVAIKKLVFDPLEMHQTFYCPDDNAKKLCAPTEISPHLNRLLVGEVHDRKGYLMGGVSGHAGVFSHITDLEHYIKMVLNEGKYQESVFLKPNFIQDLYTPFTKELEVRRGIGFIVQPNALFSSLNTNKAIVHTGFTGTSLLIDVERRVGIALFSNRVHPSRANSAILEWRGKFHETVMKLCVK